MVFSNCTCCASMTISHERSKDLTGCATDEIVCFFSTNLLLHLNIPCRDFLWLLSLNLKEASASRTWLTVASIPQQIFFLHSIIASISSISHNACSCLILSQSNFKTVSLQAFICFEFGCIFVSLKELVVSTQWDNVKSFPNFTCQKLWPELLSESVFSLEIKIWNVSQNLKFSYTTVVKVCAVGVGVLIGIVLAVRL